MELPHTCGCFFNLRRHHVTSAVAVILLLVILLPGCGSNQGDGGDEIQLSGTVEAREVDLAFQVGGRIDRLNRDEGNWVSAGDVVAEIDPKDLQLALQQTTATANAAKANLDALKAGTRVQELRVAEADLQKARSQLNFAQSEVKRVSFLVPKQLASDEQLEQAQLRYETALASVEQAKQQLNLLKEGPRREDITRAEQEYLARTEASEISKLQLDYTKLTSPVTGMVTVRLRESGEVVAPGQPVVRIAETAKPWIRAYINETQLGNVKVGQAAQIQVDSFPDKTFPATLTFISPVAEFTPKTVETRELRVDLVYRIKVEVDNPDGLLKVGMPADVILKTVSPKTTQP
ncbi:MAG: efflux RND transporter periplasmic adaptor subunit [Gammaproteobacteria bacterium]|jgi:HlyD family secretion protein